MPTPSTDRAALDRALEESLHTHWDARVVDYDAERFPFAAWVLDRVRARGHAVDDLTAIHRQVPEHEVYALSKALCADTARPDFRALVHAFVRDVVTPAGALVPPLALQRALNVRIMLPDRPQAVFPFHTGLLYGHGPASRSLWLPLTDLRAPAMASASMFIIGLDRSRELVAAAAAEHLSIGQMRERFLGEAHPLHAGPGQVVLFNQENLHGNVVNTTGLTRVSIDFRVAEGRFGDRLARKPVGGYFALLPDVDAAPAPPADPARFDNGRPTVLYLHNATPATAGAPVHLQRLMLADYAQRHGLVTRFEFFELDALGHLPTLEHIGRDLGANVVLYSVFALPEDGARRDALLDAFLARGATMHFVNEGLQLAGPGDRAALDALCAFARYGVG